MSSYVRGFKFCFILWCSKETLFSFLLKLVPVNPVTHFIRNASDSVPRVWMLCAANSHKCVSLTVLHFRTKICFGTDTGFLHHMPSISQNRKNWTIYRESWFLYNHHHKCTFLGMFCQGLEGCSSLKTQPLFIENNFKWFFEPCPFMWLLGLCTWQALSWLPTHTSPALTGISYGQKLFACKFSLGSGGHFSGQNYLSFICDRTSPNANCSSSL